jgi:hypothetical protein
MKVPLYVHIWIVCWIIWLLIFKHTCLSFNETKLGQKKCSGTKSILLQHNQSLLFRFLRLRNIFFQPIFDSAQCCSSRLSSPKVHNSQPLDLFWSNWIQSTLTCFFKIHINAFIDLIFLPHSREQLLLISVLLL